MTTIKQENTFSLWGLHVRIYRMYLFLLIKQAYMGFAIVFFGKKQQQLSFWTTKQLSSLKLICSVRLNSIFQTSPGCADVFIHFFFINSRLSLEVRENKKKSLSVSTLQNKDYLFLYKWKWEAGAILSSLQRPTGTKWSNNRGQCWVILDNAQLSVHHTFFLSLSLATVQSHHLSGLITLFQLMF